MVRDDRGRHPYPVFKHPAQLSFDPADYHYCRKLHCFRALQLSLPDDQCARWTVAVTDEADRGGGFLPGQFYGMGT